MLYDLTFVVDILFVCIYVLAVAMFVISIGRGKKREPRAVNAPTHEEREALDVGSHVESAQAATGAAYAHVAADDMKTGHASSAKGEGSRGADAPAPAKKARSRSSASRRDDARRKGSTGIAASVDETNLDDVIESSLEERLSALSLVEPLSPRETEVASLMLRGNTVPAIARKLFISENTVRGHTKAIYRKLNVHSKQELIDLIG